MTEVVCGVLPEDKPRYLMGVGTPENLLENMALSGHVRLSCHETPATACCLLERHAQHENEKWSNDHSLLDPRHLPVDAQYSKAYVRHLLKANEYLALYICSVHNLAFYLELARQARAHITGDFTEWKNAVVPQLN